MATNNIPDSAVIHPRIDVFAQRALIRMFRNPSVREEAAAMLAAVKSGSLGGIYKEDQQVPAKAARQLGKGWWQLIPKGKDATLIGEPKPAMDALVDAKAALEAPLIVFRNSVRSDPMRLDPALLEAFREFSASSAEDPPSGIIPINFPVSGGAPGDTPPPLTDWKRILSPDVRDGNDVDLLIDGRSTYTAMAKAIKTAKKKGHYIYLLGWWLSDDLPLIANDKGSTIRKLFSDASDNDVQVRAMLWANISSFTKRGLPQNMDEAARINGLRNGAAILDSHTTSLVGAHHQKLLVVRGDEGLIAFCGGVDVNRDRVDDIGRGSPQHDVHCRVKGPAAKSLLDVFMTRWSAHPATFSIDLKQGDLLGRQDKGDGPAGGLSVKIGQTFTARNPLGSGEIRIRTIKDMMLKAFAAAEQFIYIEDQYLVSEDAARALNDTLKTKPNFQHLIILIPASEISDLPQRWFRRARFITLLQDGLSSAQRGKIAVCTRGTGPHTYVHAKCSVIDDELAIIGSANCNRRGWESDSEVIAAIFGKVKKGMPFAKMMRIALWAHHLGAVFDDPLQGAAFWHSPPRGSSIQTYDPFAKKDSVVDLQLNWDTVDPGDPKSPIPVLPLPIPLPDVPRPGEVFFHPLLGPIMLMTKDTPGAPFTAKPLGGELSSSKNLSQFSVGKTSPFAFASKLSWWKVG